MLTGTEERLLSTEEAAQYLNVSYSWLKKQVAGKRVPHTKLGRRVLFSSEHLAQIVSAGEQTVISNAVMPSRGSARSRL